MTDERGPAAERRGSEAEAGTEAGAAVRVPHTHDTREAILFGGVYGAVLASSMVAALSQYGHTSPARRGYDAVWVLVTAFASALAHGYAHYIAERAPQRRWDALRTLAEEWPLVAAVLPTVVVLAGAYWGWWSADGVEYPAFVMNIVLLFGLGVVTARWTGRGWIAAGLTGAADALFGVVVVVVNAFIK